MYDAIIVGGGLAGLANTIRLAEAGLKVALFEKNTYPFHKVCGEYISNESRPYLQSLGLDLEALGAVDLNQFRLTSPRGNSLRLSLGLGGFGISRYRLDNALYQRALALDAEVLTGQSIRQIQQINPQTWEVENHLHEVFQAKVIIGSYGKRSNLDASLKRAFFQKRSPYIGVKYHIRYPEHPNNEIALHNFKNGYCGISRIEDDKYCLCYLSRRENLKQHENIAAMEAAILAENPFLADIFAQAEFLYDKPKVINEISFAPKVLVEQGILMCGDTAGMIAPLCGNGMSMALHSSKLLSDLLIAHFAGKISRQSLEADYQKQWRKLFSTRLWVGRNVQKMFGHPQLTELLLNSAALAKPLARQLVRLTHGKAF